MAPTETLAEQHFLTIEGLCAELGVRVALLTSSITARERRAAHQLVASGDVGIAVGTHALIQREVEFADLAVAVVDEQHRFGVEQRAALAEGRSPHVLHMTATPIPRTLALTVYGDLAVSEISAPPANRKPIVTAWVTEERSSEAYTRLRTHLDEGRQAYVVCPLVEGSETTLARAAEDEAERLRADELRGYRVGCVHGRLKTADRRAVMAAFKARRARRARRDDRDRGRRRRPERDDHDRPGGRPLRARAAPPAPRPGRPRARSSRTASSSRATADELSETAIERLEAMVATTDGFELAERDLEIRGEGQLVGARQSGLTDLRFTRLRADRDLLERAKELARRGRRRGAPRRGRRARCSARRSTSASPEPGSTRRGAARMLCRCASSPARTGPPDRGAEGRAHAPDRRPRPRGALQPRRSGGGRVGARPLRGLGRARARGALPRRAALRVRRDATRPQSA